MPSSTTYTYNAANEISTINASAVTYDDAGNLTDDATYDYYYDHENRLTRVADGGGTLADYTYDALGRRIQTIANSSTTRYYYDGWRVLRETDENDAAQCDYAYGNYLDEVLFMVADLSDTPTDYYFACDHLYSPSALLSDAGVVLERYEYDAYGQRRVYDPDFSDPRTTSNYTLTIAFTGQRLDLLDEDALPLMYYKNRSYSPTLARFLQRDPLGYAGRMNLYEYGLSSPIVYADPEGLCGELPSPWWPDNWNLPRIPAPRIPRIPSLSLLLKDVSNWECSKAEDAILDFFDGHLRDSASIYFRRTSTTGVETLSESNMDRLINEFDVIQQNLSSLTAECFRSYPMGWKNKVTTDRYGGSRFVSREDAGTWRGTLNYFTFTITSSCDCSGLYWCLNFKDKWDFNRVDRNTLGEIGDNLARDTIVDLILSHQYRCGWKPFWYTGHKCGFSPRSTGLVI